MAATMKAAVRDAYGSPEGIRLDEVPRPTPAADGLLVRVHAASVNKGDTEILLGSPFWVRLSGFGFFSPRQRILGTNLAGRVEAVGSEVNEFQVGDEVFGDVLYSGLGAFAEYLAIPQTATICRKPAEMDMETAASLPEAGFIALQGLAGALEPGKRVLINGAGGGAGSFGIQLAKAHGAEVTGVDHTDKQEWMRSLGADHVVDYTRGEPISGGPYDVVLDVVGAQPLTGWKRVLAPQGVYRSAGGTLPRILNTLIGGAMLSRKGGKRLGMLAVQPNRDDLKTMAELVQSGKIEPTVERVWPLSEAAEALRHVAAGRARGRVVVKI